MKVWVDKARRPEMIGGIGGFAGLFDASALKSFDRPLLATSADGVGTKVAIAQAMDIHHTIGFDLVGMLVDDLVVCGAEPLFLTDYIATGRVVPERIAAIVQGIAEACVQAGCALVGGETAEHPGLLGPDEYDVAGSTTGVVEAADLLGPGRVEAGDVVIAMASSGLHSNGYSLVRHVLLEHGAGWSLDRHVDELGRTLGEELLEPTTDLRQGLPGPGPQHRHPRDVARHRRRPGREPRAGAAGQLVATLDRGTWTPAPVFDLVRQVGSVAQADLERTLNCGVGMVAHHRARRRRPGASACWPATACAAWVCGEIGEATGAAGAHGGRHGRRMRGSHPGW